MHGEILLVVLVLTVGCAAFFFCMVYLIGRFLAFLGRRIFGVFTGNPGPDVPPHRAGNAPFRVCPRQQCRKVERRPARFCSQCGARLAESPDYVPF